MTCPGTHAHKQESLSPELRPFLMSLGRARLDACWVLVARAQPLWELQASLGRAVLVYGGS